MESLINESVNLILKEFFNNFNNFYIILFLLINFYNCIKIITIIPQISNIIKQQIEINKKILIIKNDRETLIKQLTEIDNRISMIKNDRETFIKSIVLKCIQEHINISDKNYLILIKKQNNQIRILRKKINAMNNKNE